MASHMPGTPFGVGDVYVPIFVGRAVSIFKEEMADMIGDDPGENISAKNPSYCAMTAHFWMWKNVRDAEFVGLNEPKQFVLV